MKSFTEYLWFTTQNKKEILHITPQVRDLVHRSAIREGMCLVSAMHITASVFVNDLESGLHEDILEWAENVAPENPNYHHHRTGEDNADAHLKRMLVGHQVVVPVTRGELDLGPWEQLFYGEWDGQRRKRVVVKIIGE
jgi:secondary thiamine-phosphate synthase enzyme